MLQQHGVLRASSVSKPQHTEREDQQLRLPTCSADRDEAVQREVIDAMLARAVRSNESGVVRGGGVPILSMLAVMPFIGAIASSAFAEPLAFNAALWIVGTLVMSTIHMLCVPLVPRQPEPDSATYPRTKLGSRSLSGSSQRPPRLRERARLRDRRAARSVRLGFSGYAGSHLASTTCMAFCVPTCSTQRKPCAVRSMPGSRASPRPSSVGE